MFEEPQVDHGAILVNLKRDFGIAEPALEFLPLGADMGSAVYRCGPWFVKLRRKSVFTPLSVLVPRFLSERGIAGIIPPVSAQDGRLWSEFGEFNLILYPFIQGENANTRPLDEDLWQAFGRLMRSIHDLSLPADLAAQISHETFAGKWRDQIRAYLERETPPGADPIALETLDLLKRQRGTILGLLDDAERGAAEFGASQRPKVLCHTDNHAFNLIITPDQRLFLVDWDQPMLAMRERDLMFIGWELGFGGASRAEERRLFSRGYGPAEINAQAIFYYRCERILEDMAEFCWQILDQPPSPENQADREQSFWYLASGFEPDGAIDLAYREIVG